MDDASEMGKLAAEFVARNLVNLLNVATSIISGAKSELELRLKTAYSTYLTTTADRYGRAKSFFFRQIPTDIYSFYVPMRVTSGATELPKVSLNDIVNLTKRAVVTAPAGAGKSILLRHLFLTALQCSDRIPVFIELRSIDDPADTILDAIKQNLVSCGFDLGDKYVDKAISLGHFILLLDGFDEVKSEIRPKLSKDIVALAQQAPDCIVIVSSRQDDVFTGWQDFREFTVAPLTVDEACELVEKLPSDAELKEKFVSDLRGFLFDRHKSFLSNPLLLSIMLLTYGESGHIPKKLSLFYHHAYEALFQRHDSLKGGYQRDRRTSLDIYDFARVFGAFCLQTYDARKFQFSRSDALEYIRKAKSYVGLEVEAADYLDDCLQAVCLLMEDGLNVVFSHRSFQEYFVAHYIQGADSRVQTDLLQRFTGAMQTDNVYTLLFEMNPALVERELLVPRLRTSFEELGVKRNVGITHFSRFLKTNFTHIRVTKNGLGFLAGPRKTESSLSLEIIVFAYHHCVRSQDRTVARDRLDVFVDKYGKSEESLYDLNGLSINNPLMKELAKLRGLFSVDGLDQVFRLSRDLERKHAGVRASLQELLK